MSGPATQSDTPHQPQQAPDLRKRQCARGHSVSICAIPALRIMFSLSPGSGGEQDRSGRALGPGQDNPKRSSVTVTPVGQSETARDLRGQKVAR